MGRSEEQRQDRLRDERHRLLLQATALRPMAEVRTEQETDGLLGEIIGDDGGMSAWQVEDIHSPRILALTPGAIVFRIDRFQSHDFITDCSAKLDLDMRKAAANLLDEPDRPRHLKMRIYQMMVIADFSGKQKSDRKTA